MYLYFAVGWVSQKQTQAGIKADSRWLYLLMRLDQKGFCLQEMMAVQT